jgi:hypothetical protein
MSDSWELFTDECDADLPAATVVEVQDYVVVRPLRFAPPAGGVEQTFVLANDYVTPGLVRYELDRRLHDVVARTVGPTGDVAVEKLRGGCPIALDQIAANPQVKVKRVVELSVDDVGSFLADSRLDASTPLALTTENASDLAVGRPTIVDHGDQLVVVTPQAGLDPGDGQPLLLTADLPTLLAEPYVTLAGRRERLGLDGRAVGELASTGNTVVGLNRDADRRVTIHIVNVDLDGAMVGVSNGVAVQRSAAVAAPSGAKRREQDQPQSKPTATTGIHEIVHLPEFPIVLCATYRQKWSLKGYARGRIISSIPVAPQEEVTVEVTTIDKRVTTWEQATSEERTTASEATVSGKTSHDVVDELTRNKNWKLTAGGEVSVPIKAVTLNGSVGTELTKQTQKVDKETLQTIVEETVKASQTVRSKVDTKVTETHEWSTETKSTRKLRNPNVGRLVVYDFFEVLGGFDLDTQIVPDSLQLGVAVDLPFNATFDRAFILRHEGVLAGALLDDRQKEGLAAARWLAAHDLWCAGTCRCARKAPPPSPIGDEVADQPAGSSNKEPSSQATAVEHSPELDAACTAIQSAIEDLRDASYKTLADLVGAFGKPDSEWRAAELKWHRYLYRRYGLEAFNSLFWAACNAFADVPSPSRWDLEKLLRSADTGFIETVIRGLAIQLQAIDLTARLAVDLVQLTWKLPVMAGKANFDDAALGVAISRGRRALEAVEDEDEARDSGSTSTTPGDGKTDTTGKTQPPPTQGVTAAADPYPEEECARKLVAEHALIEHLRFNQDHYLGALWNSLGHLDQQRMLMARYETLVDWTDPTALAVLDGKLVLPLATGRVPDADQALIKARADLAAAHETATKSVVLPTGATHVQGRLGRCDVLEPALVDERRHALDERAAQATLAQHTAAQAEAETARYLARLDHKPQLLGDPEGATDPGSTPS